MSETRERYDAGSQAQPGELFTLQLTRLELISLNRGLNCWLAELRLKRFQAEPGDELAQTIDQASDVAAGVCRRVDELLGIV